VSKKRFFSGEGLPDDAGPCRKSAETPAARQHGRDRQDDKPHEEQET
jgi:hypothetical protein